MSRWNDAYDNHGFRPSWVELKEILSKQVVDDKSILTNVTELARLRKVISFLDEAMNALDPELVPLSTWDAFHSQTAACIQSVKYFESNRDISYLHQANNYADNLLTYIRPYYIPSKHTGKALREAISSYATTITEYGESFRVQAQEILEELDSQKDRANSANSDIKEIEQRIKDLQSELFEGDEAIELKLTEFQETAEEKTEQIKKFYNATFLGSRDRPSIESETSRLKELATSDQKRIQGLLNETSIKKEKFDEFFVKVFGKKNEEDELEGGLAEDLNNRIEALDDFKKKQELRYATLNKEIEGLLPGATSAGLASAYKEMKDSFNTPIEKSTNLFYVAIGILIFGSLILAIETIGEFGITFFRFSDWETILKSLAYKIPFYAPTVWLAYYASKRRSEYQRLQQEYAHKEALAKSYNNYKQQLQDLDTEDLAMQKIFINKAIDAIAYNASQTLDGKHGDKMPIQDFVEKFVESLDSSQITELLKKSKKL